MISVNFAVCVDFVLLLVLPLTPLVVAIKEKSLSTEVHRCSPSILLLSVAQKSLIRAVFRTISKS